MATKRKHSRLVLTLIALALVGAALTAAFWPRPVLVDMDMVRLGTMRVTIDEEGRTQVHEPYVVSSPVAGELQRITVLPGQKVTRNETVVARMRPANPTALDARTREQAQAAVTAAEAAVQVAHADLNAAMANQEYADSELQRVSRLVERGITSKVTRERAEQEARVAHAAVNTARAAIAMRVAELNSARAQLISFENEETTRAMEEAGPTDSGIPILAPIDGTILKLVHKSETTLPAGEPILEIGDVTRDLEIEVELLSSDAVQVRPGDPVIITNWGGDGDLKGRVERIDPYGYTKYSALGVEEQRVKVTIRFTGDSTRRDGLGHGYRVEVRIVIWEGEDVTLVPSSALFRHRNDWAVFRVTEDGVAQLQIVRIGPDNGTVAQLRDGLSPGDRVVLFPSASLSDGQRVAQRRVE